jgi:hypothetical protein
VVDTDSRKYYEAQWEVFNYNRASNDQCIYKFFISKYNEIDKSSLPTDVIESVVRLIDIFDGPKNTLFINGAYELILKIRKLLFQLTEDKLKQIKL